MKFENIVLYVPDNFSFDRDLIIDAKASSYGKEYIYIYALNGGKNA
jgi:hypothetical protein